MNSTIAKAETKSKNEIFLKGSFLHFFQSAKNYLLAANEITYIQADHVYVRIFTRDGKQILQRSSLGRLLKILPNEFFVQTHRSFIVNTNHVKEWSAQSVMVQNEIIPISRSRKKMFRRKIK